MSTYNQSRSSHKQRQNKASIEPSIQLWYKLSLNSGIPPDSNRKKLIIQVQSVLCMKYNTVPLKVKMAYRQLDSHKICRNARQHADRFVHFRSSDLCTFSFPPHTNRPLPSFLLAFQKDQWQNDLIALLQAPAGVAGSQAWQPQQALQKHV